MVGSADVWAHGPCVCASVPEVILDGSVRGSGHTACRFMGTSNPHYVCTYHLLRGL